MHEQQMFKFYCDVTMMLFIRFMRSQSISYLNVTAYHLAGLPEQQPHRIVRTTVARNKHCEKLRLNFRPAQS